MKVLGWIIALLGLWEAGDIALPFTIGFNHVQPFVWNHIIVGIILVVAGARAGMASDTITARKMSWIAAVSGVWLIVASFMLRPREITAGLWNDIAVGVIVLILSSASSLFLRRRG